MINADLGNALEKLDDFLSDSYPGVNPDSFSFYPYDLKRIYTDLRFASPTEREYFEGLISMEQPGKGIYEQVEILLEEAPNLYSIKELVEKERSIKQGADLLIPVGGPCFAFEFSKSFKIEGYVQLNNGFLVPEWLADEAVLPYEKYSKEIQLVMPNLLASLKQACFVADNLVPGKSRF
jgi:hypothetical protein